MRKVLVGGVFNLIHQGHLYFFQHAKKFGDFLIVVLATDKTARSTKKHQIKPVDVRKKALEKLEIVDKVVIGDEKDFMKPVEREKPDIIVLGYDQEMNESELREKLRNKNVKCDVIRVKNKLKGYSTTGLMKKFK